jgi:hypothetical protein
MELWVRDAGRVFTALLALVVICLAIGSQGGNLGGGGAKPGQITLQNSASTCKSFGMWGNSGCRSTSSAAREPKIIGSRSGGWFN